MCAGSRRGTNDAHGSSVRRRSRKRAQPNSQSNVETSSDVGNEINEVAPVEIWFGPYEKEHLGPVAVDAVAKLNLWPRQFGRDAINNAGNGSTSSLVNEKLGVEGGENFGVHCVEKRAHGGPCTQARVNPTFHGNYQDGLDEIRICQKQHSFVGVVVHHFLSNVFLAVCASSKMCLGNSVTLP